MSLSRYWKTRAYISVRRKAGRHLPGSCAQWASDKEEIMERDLFLRKYRIEQEDFDAAGVSWEELTAIADHYATIEGKLREIGKDFVDKYLWKKSKKLCVPVDWEKARQGISVPACGCY